MDKKQFRQIIFRFLPIGLVVVLPVLAWGSGRIAGEALGATFTRRSYCCNGDPKCDRARTCTVNGNILTISAGMGFFDTGCNFSSIDTTSTSLNVLEAKIIEYDAQNRVIPNPLTGLDWTWILENDLQYCNKDENVGVPCTSTGFDCRSNYTTRTIECTLDLSKTICWRIKDFDGGKDKCIGPWVKNPNTKRIEVNLVYDDLGRQMCCESTYCYYCSCILETDSIPTPTPTPTLKPTPTPTTTVSSGVAAGKVVTCGTANGIAGVQVKVYNDTWNQTTKYAITDSNGNWSVSDILRPGDGYAVRISSTVPPAGHTYDKMATTTDYSWDHCNNYNAPGSFDYTSYECQRSGQNDCAGPNAGGATGRCSFCYEPASEGPEVEFVYKIQGAVNPPEVLGAVIKIREKIDIGEYGPVAEIGEEMVLQGGGEYRGVIRGLNPGEYEFTVKSSRHLSKKYRVTVAASDLGEVRPADDTRAVAGEAVDYGVSENLIDIIDLTAVLDRMDQVGVPASLVGDVDYDGVVTILDLTAVLENFDKAGEEL